MLETVSIFGLAIARGSRGEILSRVSDEASGGRQIAVATLNAEMVVRAYEDKSFGDALKTMDVIICDGKSVSRSIKKIAGADVETYPGIEFAFDLVKAGADKDMPVYLLGAKDGIANRASENLKSEIPGCRIAGAHHGYFRGADEDIVRAINDSGARILLAALGSPFQEFWIEKHRKNLTPRILVGVGGTFDVWSGELKRAPRWISKAGIEWLYRALTAPGRIGRLSFIPRYLKLEKEEIKRSNSAR